MSMVIHSDPVGLPGLAAIALGFVIFLFALLAARLRAGRGATVAVTRRKNASIVWIIVQGIAIGIVGFGPLRVLLDPGSPKAIAEGTAALLLMLGAVWLFDASSRTMGKNWSLVARTREDHQLVQSGPFAVVRHPIYVALFFFMVAMAIAYGHTRNLLLAVPMYAIATWLRVRHEERILREQFGADYDAYAARVKRFVPGVF
ncbi:protein-S-isoprenylcysteine O-methyltransferase [Sphingomonas oligophenolica]|uniref:Isoprenylcysteine carboxylmethyltransferase family protein n=1 Tax=Sphingomonas oligophenolica TaxID=301154 RepID=A0ABU9XXM4_9SPHN